MFLKGDSQNTPPHQATSSSQLATSHAHTTPPHNTYTGQLLEIMPSNRSLFVALLVAASAVLLQVHAAPGAKANHLTPALARAILLAGMEHEMDGVATAVRFFLWFLWVVFVRRSVYVGLGLLFFSIAWGLVGPPVVQMGSAFQAPPILTPSTPSFRSFPPSLPQDMPLTKTEANTTCITTYCQDAALACVKDKACRTALSCLSSCDELVDDTPDKINLQKCTADCVVTYENDALDNVNACFDSHDCITLTPIPLTCRDTTMASPTFQNVTLMEGEWWATYGKVSPPQSSFPSFLSPFPRR